MGFLDGAARADSALAITETELLVLSRDNFNVLAENHRRLASIFILAIAKVLASRLRQANNELRILVHS
jgi:SulP family sulfate permease